MSVTFHIRKAGSFTSALYKMAKKKQEVSILLEGPYGNLAVDILSDRKYKRIMLISGGIGRKCFDFVLWMFFAVEPTKPSLPEPLWLTLKDQTPSWSKTTISSDADAIHL